MRSRYAEALVQRMKACSSVLVDDNTGTLMFNAEDPAALLTIALQKMHPVRQVG